MKLDNPWLKFAGMYQGDPLFDDVLKAIEEYRRELDADTKTPQRIPANGVAN